MKKEQFMRYLRRDGWLLAALCICAALCLFLGTVQPQTSASPQEQRLAQVLSLMDGAGAVDVALHYDTDDFPCSAIVIADGADHAAVRIHLTTAVSTLLGIDSSRIAVYQRNAGGS